MIARLRGILAEKQADQLILDVNGVGYRVMTTLSTFYQLPEPGRRWSSPSTPMSAIRLWICTGS